jgi:hypothetical protein
MFTYCFYYIFKLLLKPPESMTQIYNNKLNKIEIYYFYSILHMCPKKVLFSSFQTYFPFWLKYLLLVVFEKLFFFS